MMPLSRLRLVAAKYCLNLASSEELTQVAHALLDEGIYSHALGELATVRYPTMREVAPLFELALEELTIPISSREDAVRFLVRQCICNIVEGGQTPFEVLRHFRTGLYDPLAFTPVIEQIENFDIYRSLYSWFHEYEYLTELVEDEYYDREEARQRLAALDGEVKEFAAAWMREKNLGCLNPAWLAWNGKTVLKLAQAIDDERTFGRLPILADALEEAGCTNLDILDHCRQAGEHVRGCWVVDLILGKP